ncbi:MAG TPA: hypothetical protein VM240_10870 [Verrucomicrobiae bacterium]|nr:hypothetical protein [Verrucomicrobiae bacterium]
MAAILQSERKGQEMSLAIRGDHEMSLFKTKVIAPKSGGSNFAPMGVVEAGFQSAYLANDAEVESFRVLCIEEIERVCATLKRGMRSASDKILQEHVVAIASRAN